LEGLVEIAPHHAENVGLRMLGDIDPTVRWWAVYYVSILGARNGTRIAVPALVHLLTADSDELVRSLAASALGDLGDGSALPALEAAAANDHGTDHEGVPNSRTARKAIQKIMQRNGA
jgi:HEAT repeat protein